MDLEDHQISHILATSTRVKAGSAPVISADFARRRVVTQMLEGWNLLFQSKKYIRSNFLILYQRKDTPFVLTYVKSGPWVHKVGHSHSLTVRLVCCTTVHAPIGVYHSRFFPEESTACRCGFPMDTVSHVLYQSPSYEWELEPKNSCVIRGCSNSYRQTSPSLHLTFPSPIQARGSTMCMVGEL
jgi:hypothetical protein